MEFLASLITNLVEKGHRVGAVLLLFGLVGIASTHIDAPTQTALLQWLGLFTVCAALGLAIVAVSFLYLVFHMVGAFLGHILVGPLERMKEERATETALDLPPAASGSAGVRG